MLNEIVSSSKVYIVTGYTDMRKGIDGLAQIIGGKYEQDIYSKRGRQFVKAFIFTLYRIFLYKNEQNSEG